MSAEDIANAIRQAYETGYMVGHAHGTSGMDNYYEHE